MNLGESGRIWENLGECGRVCESVLTTRATRAQQREQELGKSWERAGEELGKSWAIAGGELGKSQGKLDLTKCKKIRYDDPVAPGQ